jgi:hypothetical protein
VTVNCALVPAAVSESETALPPIAAGTGVGVGDGVGVGVGVAVGTGVGVGVTTGVGVGVGVAMPVVIVGALVLPPLQPATKTAAATVSAANPLRTRMDTTSLFVRISTPAFRCGPD